MKQPLCAINCKSFGRLLVATLLFIATFVPTPVTSAVVVGYFTDWTATSYPATAVPYSKLTHLNYGFGLVDQTTLAVSVADSNLLKTVVKLAHAKKTKVAISLGGWTGSRYFSTIASTSTSRQTFVTQVAKFIAQFGLDGLDLDWEFPGRAGMACNVVDPIKDTANLLELLKLLKKTLPKTVEVTMAVRVQPFDGPNGPLANVASHAQYIDRINIMAYDLNGVWSATTGPNAPLTASSAGGDPFSFSQSASSWYNAGFPRSKIVLGIPFYGRATTPTANMTTSMYVPLSKTQPKGDSDDEKWAEPCPGAVPVYSSVWKWSHLRSEGVLPGVYTAGAGWKRTWDTTTQTPWLYNKAKSIFISYDDPQSVQAKVNYIKRYGYAGGMVWALNQDNGELINVVSQLR